jgi:hypothetical protein
MNGQLKRFIIVLVSFVTLILLPFWLGIIAMRMHIRGWEDYVLQWLLGICCYRDNRNGTRLSIHYLHRIEGVCFIR